MKVKMKKPVKKIRMENRPVVSVRAVPQRTAMAFNQHNGVVQIPIDRIEGHQMIELVF